MGTYCAVLDSQGRWFLALWSSSGCFSVQDCQVGLNFSSDQESEAFRGAVEDKIAQRAQRQGQFGPQIQEYFKKTTTPTVSSTILFILLQRRDSIIQVKVCLNVSFIYIWNMFLSFCHVDFSCEVWTSIWACCCLTFLLLLEKRGLPPLPPPNGESFSMCHTQFAFCYD